MPQRLKRLSVLVIPLLWAAGLLGSGTLGFAEPVRVAIGWPAGKGPAPASSVHIRAVPRASLGEPGAARELSVATATDEAVLDLGEGVWTLSATADTFWSAPVDVHVQAGSGGAVALAVWPAGSVSGQLQAVEDETSPEEIELRFSGSATPEGAPGSEGQYGPLEGRLRCPVENGRWRCMAPAGVLDLRLKPKGFVPAYFWDVGVAANAQTDLGAVSLRRGASVAGRIGKSDGSVPRGPCRAELQIAGPRSRGQRVATSGEAGTPPSFVSHVDERGFFQIAEIPLGEHFLAVECPSARARVPVAVRSSGEIRLPEPLVVQDLLSLDVNVEPQVDPSGRPWRLNVYTQATGTQIASGVPLSPDGRLVLRGVSPGNCQIHVLSDAGARWLTKTIDLSERTGPLYLRIPLMPISGRVRLPTRPVRAQVIFGDPSGAMLIPFESDNQGLFKGYLPRLRQSQDQGWTVDIHALLPPLNFNHHLENVVVSLERGQETAWLDIVLPPVAVRGTVVSEDGRPQAGILVLATDMGAGGATQSVVTDGDGYFELVGLAKGLHRIVADSPDGFSEPLEVAVADDPDQEVQLVLKAASRFVGEIVSGDGPVAGAEIRTWLPPGAQRDSIHAEPNGSFAAKLPSEVDEIGVSVGAPGYALKIMRVPVRGSDAVEIPLDTVSGQLVVEKSSDSRGSATTPATVVVLHEGAVEGIDFLTRWGAMNGGGAIGNRVVVPLIEPGDYAACLVPAEEMPAIWSGEVPQDRCSTGTLLAGEQLALSLPVP